MVKRFLHNQNGRIIPFVAAVELIHAILEKGGVFHLAARGSSMEPFIRPGDRITLSSYVDDTIPAVGDVIAAYFPEKNLLIVHRLIARRPDGYIMAGDNAHNMDGLIRPESIIGVVTEVERNAQKKKLGVTCCNRIIAWGRRQSLRNKVLLVIWRGALRMIKKVMA